jgi:hypothetical protein
MKNDKGYILLIVLVIVCVITFAIVGLTTRTTEASYLAAKRSGTVRAFSLAESAAMEGYWYLTADPNCRTGQERHWNSEWYRFSIIDDSPLDDPSGDLSLVIIGEGHVSNEQRKVKLVLTRLDQYTAFTLNSWQEDN